MSFLDSIMFKQIFLITSTEISFSLQLSSLKIRLFRWLLFSRSFKRVNISLFSTRSLLISTFYSLFSLRKVTSSVLWHLSRLWMQAYLNFYPWFYPSSSSTITLMSTIFSSNWVFSADFIRSYSGELRDLPHFSTRRKIILH